MVPLTYYCVLILLVSVFGGMIPVWWNLTHRWMELSVSFVAGIMFGVATLHMLPHAVAEALRQAPTDLHMAITHLMLWLVVGFVTMFLIERFFCFHHHEAPAEDGNQRTGDRGQGTASERHGTGCGHEHTQSDHIHDITWSGAAVGLTLHSMLAGVGLAASVAHGSHGGGLPGLGVFLVIFLHKPFDAMTIATLMARSGWSLTMRCVVNGVFALAVPLGAVLFLLGFSTDIGPTLFALPPALAFSAGVFLCIAGSDLLPELQFHHHDRLKLSAALIAGLAIAYVAGRLEGNVHQHPESNQVKNTVVELD